MAFYDVPSMAAVDEEDDEWAPDSKVGDPAFEDVAFSPPQRSVPAGGYSFQSQNGGGDGGGRSGRQSSSARAAFRAIGELGKKIDATREDLMAQNRETREALKEHSDQDRHALEKIHGKIEEQNRTLVSLQVSAGKTETALEAMASQMRHAREIERVEVQTDGTMKVEKTKNDGLRIKLWIALVGVIGVAVGAVVKWATG